LGLAVKHERGRGKGKAVLKGGSRTSVRCDFRKGTREGTENKSL